MKRLALGYDALAGGHLLDARGGLLRRQAPRRSRRRSYDLLYSLLDLVTTLDPRFNVAYRFGAIFLAEAYPSGPGRPDQAIALLQRGIERSRPLGVHARHRVRPLLVAARLPKAAEWFERGAQRPGARGVAEAAGGHDAGGGRGPAIVAPDVDSSC